MSSAVTTFKNGFKFFRPEWKSVLQTSTSLAPVRMVAILSGLFLVIAIPALAQKETVLYRFKGKPDGSFAGTGVAKDATGTLYGTTTYGGAQGNGIVYKVTPTGKETVLYSFAGPDGANPFTGVVLDKAGNIYGTTNSGGANNHGTVFKLTPTGKETVLFSFNNVGTDGYTPKPP
jgi:uncharacterized repeat protein (TIGR03803 family)